MSELSTEKSGPPPSWISLSIYVLPSSVFPFATKLANPINFIPVFIKITITIANVSKEDNINNSLSNQILSVPGVINIPVCKKHYIV